MKVIARRPLLLRCTIFALGLGSAVACGLGGGIDLPSADGGEWSPGSTDNSDPDATTGNSGVGPGDSGNEAPDSSDTSGEGGWGGTGPGDDGAGGAGSGGAGSGGTASGGTSSGGSPN